MTFNPNHKDQVVTEREAFNECVKAENHYREMADMANKFGPSTSLNEKVRVAFIDSQKARAMYEAVREVSY